MKKDLCSIKNLNLCIYKYMYNMNWCDVLEYGLLSRCHN